jgi:two-component system response regulator ResD
MLIRKNHILCFFRTQDDIINMVSRQIAELNMMEKHKILVVDDEERIRKLLRMYLEKDGYRVEEAADGSKALEMMLATDYDLIILDLMLPIMNGIEVCIKLREIESTPIIMLTAKGEEIDRIKGFEVGTDDYIVKPFSPREVLYRVNSVIRRSATTLKVRKDTRFNALIFPHLTIDLEGHTVTADGKLVQLTPKEFDLLHYLASSPDKVFSRENLLKDVWHYDFFGDLRTVDTHIKRLREHPN